MSLNDIDEFVLNIALMSPWQQLWNVYGSSRCDGARVHYSGGGGSLDDPHREEIINELWPLL